MRAFIDLDIILYRCLFAGQRDELGYYRQLQICDNKIEDIVDTLEPDGFVLVTSGGHNFREKITPTYKANRKGMERPEYLHDARKYFKKYWDAVVTHGYEADDYIAMSAKKHDVVVSIDKDFMQLGVPIYDWVKNELFVPKDPMLYFWIQMLTGDSADNVEGLKNPAKAHYKSPPNFTQPTAAEVLEGKNYKQTVQKIYQTAYGNNWFEKFDINARLLWLKRSPEDEYYLHV